MVAQLLLRDATALEGAAMTDEEMRAYIRECVVGQLPVLVEAAKEGARGGCVEIFRNLGVDVGSATGVQSWHDAMSVLRALVTIRNRVGNTIIVIVVTAFMGWAGYKLWPSWWPKQGG